ncbi:alkaline phosphatase [Adlercreutzia caecimuris]|uniref:alkaline phosphatase n=1 Tax=Adlercreutzia caecimuris TaxID=671266 RepID=UPI001C3E234B|nr:alkaline phosphatase [Adlercreutzia caecimuris]MCR2036878.1 alkaline phosphatase [Adlercreutzia caecimuris]
MIDDAIPDLVSRRNFLRGAVGLAGAVSMGALLGCSSDEPSSVAIAATGEGGAQGDSAAATPKYVFLFIGDGMSYPQIQATAYFNGTQQGGEEPTIGRVSFMDFPVIGSQYTYDSTSFCPDSASTATSIASGRKTASGVINVSPDASEHFETIAEKLKRQLGYKVGVLTSVNLNHATPAAFYAHQQSRKNYYEIGQELIASGFDYFAGGGLLNPTGASDNRIDLYEAARDAGYVVARTYDEAAHVTAGSKALLVAEKLADEDALSYAMDASADEWSLRDYVAKGIEVLGDGDAGFFMMCEGGKIDWACHANDCAAAIHDVMALEDCVAEAVAFCEDHPDETLIVVTGDHETGGLTIGYAETNYDTFLANIARQKISYAKFNSDYVAGYIDAGATYEQAMEDVAQLFGLERPASALSSGADAQAAEAEPGSLMLTAYEDEQLREAYERTVAVGVGDQEDMTQEEYVHYGTYEPFTVTLTHLLNRKSGVDFSTYAHSGLTVPVFAMGAGAEVFDGFYDNTEIYAKLAALTGVA